MNAFIITLIVILLLILPLWTLILYNRLIYRRNQADNAFADVDAYLKKRYDLIPNLVAAVREYMGHEKSVLSEITELRVEAAKTNLSNDDKIEINNKMTRALRSVNVALENYPDLKSNTNILNLQASLNEVEEQLSAARRTYNATIMLFNNSVQLFPSSIIAAIGGFREKKYFETLETERDNINVKELFKQ